LISNQPNTNIPVQRETKNHIDQGLTKDGVGGLKWEASHTSRYFEYSYDEKEDTESFAKKQGLKQSSLTLGTISQTKRPDYLKLNLR